MAAGTSRPDVWTGIALNRDPGDPNCPSVWTPLESNTFQVVSVSDQIRGRDYELAQSMSSDPTLLIRDPNEYLNPDNPSLAVRRAGQAVPRGVPAVPVAGHRGRLDRKPDQLGHLARVAGRRVRPVLRDLHRRCAGAELDDPQRCDDGDQYRHATLRYEERALRGDRLRDGRRVRGAGHPRPPVHDQPVRAPGRRQHPAHLRGRDDRLPRPVRAHHGQRLGHIDQRRGVRGDGHGGQLLGIAWHRHTGEHGRVDSPVRHHRHVSTRRTST
jgi:hypothetical protein